MVPQIMFAPVSGISEVGCEAYFIIFDKTSVFFVL